MRDNIRTSPLSPRVQPPSGPVIFLREKSSTHTPSHMHHSRLPPVIAIPQLGWGGTYAYFTSTHSTTRARPRTNARTISPGCTHQPPPAPLATLFRTPGTRRIHFDGHDPPAKFAQPNISRCDFDSTPSMRVTIALMHNFSPLFFLGQRTLYRRRMREKRVQNG